MPAQPPGRRRRIVLIVGAISGALIVVATIGVTRGLGISRDDRPAGTAQTSPSATAVSAGGQPRQTSSPAIAAPPNEPGNALLRAAFDQWRNGIDGKFGIAVAAAGAGASPVVLGQHTIDTAWSTIKVPLVIAAMRDKHLTEVTAEMTAAIIESDNAAAENIWAGMGDGATAAGKVDEVLRQAGDTTPVQPNRIRPPYTPFGQTLWSLENQTRFAAFAACDNSDKPVRILMGRIEDEQRWGLSEIPDTSFKGGWGPNVAGSYLVRQFGFITHPSGAVTAVAMAVEPASGSFADGKTYLTKMAKWLLANLDKLPAGQCGQ